MRKGALIVIIFLLAVRVYAAPTPKARRPNQATQAVPASFSPPPPPPPPPPGAPPPDFIDDDADFDDGDDLPDETDYSRPRPGAYPPNPTTENRPPVPLPQQYNSPQRSEPSHQMSSKLHFHLVPNDYWEKNKPRERGHVEQQ